MNEVTKRIRITLSEDNMQNLERIAQEQEINVSAAIRLIIDSYFDVTEKEVIPAENTASADPQQINTILQNTIEKQDALVRREISYLRKVSDDMHKNNYVYINILNSILWKMEMEDQDYFSLENAMSPVLSFAADDAEKELSRQRERRMTNERKYRKE